MLKEIIICIIIVVSIVCGDFLTQNYTKQSITEISNLGKPSILVPLPKIRIKKK